MKKLEYTSLIDIILFSLAFVSLIIGIDQSIRFGLVKSYWLFSISIFCLLFYNMRKQKRQQKEDQSPTRTNLPPKNSKKK